MRQPAKAPPRPITAIRGIAGDLLDLVLPVTCAGCGAPRQRMCSDCSMGFVYRLVPGRAVGGFPVFAAGEYAGPLRSALLGYKERGRRDITDFLAGLLLTAVRAVDDGPVLVVPVPSRRSQARRRGGDHLQRLGGALAAIDADIMVAPVLGFVRSVRDSASLGVRERADNMHGAMRAVRAPSGLLPAVVIIDDIVTTGVTLDEAADALGSAGWPVAGAAVIASTPSR
jgi:predicted amidophosphoribosyltransferase